MKKKYGDIFSRDGCGLCRGSKVLIATKIKVYKIGHVIYCWKGLVKWSKKYKMTIP